MSGRLQWVGTDRWAVRECFYGAPSGHALPKNRNLGWTIFATVILSFLGSAVLASAAVTIATYNVENYLVADRMVDGVYRDAYPKPENAKTALRQVIKSVAPDILALQEMGTQLFLDELQRDLKSEGTDYPYALLLEAADPDRHVAMLSKIPFKKVSPHAAVPVLLMGKKDKVKRGVLEVSFDTNEGELTLFVIHLKSRRTEQDDDIEGVRQRQQEAEAVRDLILTRFPDPAKGRFILCGDWNDTRNSKPVKTLQKRGQTVLGEILRAADSRGEVWTHSYYKEDSYSRIDYFLLSSDLQRLVRGGRGKIYDGPGVAEASDHRPVVLTLNLDAMK